MALTLSTWKDHLEDVNDRLQRATGVLEKRDDRVKFTHDKQHGWHVRLDDALDEHRVANAARCGRKLQFWHEQYQKALLGDAEAKAWVARLKKKKAYLLKHKPEVPHLLDGVSVPTAPWNPQRRPIANWIIPWLIKAWDNGWRGYVTSGWRDPAYSTSLCLHMCGSPTCPGRCAGATSRHSGSTFPNGAVDLTDYYTFGAIMRRIGSPLHNSLGSADPVHFSYYGN